MNTHRGRVLCYTTGTGNGEDDAKRPDIDIVLADETFVSTPTSDFVLTWASDGNVGVVIDGVVHPTYDYDAGTQTVSLWGLDQDENQVPYVVGAGQTVKISQNGTKWEDVTGCDASTYTDIPAQIVLNVEGFQELFDRLEADPDKVVLYVDPIEEVI
jgi:hypothetical protein